MADYATQEQPRRAATPTSTAFDHWLLGQLRDLVGNPQICFELWDGFTLDARRHPIALKFHDRLALCRAFYKPTYTFGNLYTSGRISVRGDMIGAMEAIYDGLRHGSAKPGRSWLRRQFTYRPKPNSERRARDNIHTHYDLGNDFYQLWLDHPYMQYTCGYYAEADFSLEQAQVAKLEYICRKLALRPGETVVEAGSGWGGLGRYLARHHGVKVRSYNISRSQVAYSRERARREGLAEAIEYVEDDYRNIDGSYDAFVSVGMLEHVGPRNFTELGATIDRCLKADGRGFIHSIGQISPRPLNEWIERRIFPGAQPPSLAQMMDIFEPHDLIVADVENLRPHYARTLRHWYERFEAHQQQVAGMFDPEFVLAWRLYLAGSAAAFTVGNLQLFQVLFRRSQCSALPATRAQIYRADLLHTRAATSA